MEAVKERGLVFTAIETEIRMKPPPNLPYEFVLNHVRTIPFFEEGPTVRFKDWKFDNGVRYRLFEDGTQEKIHKLQCGLSQKIIISSGWNARAVVSRETRYDGIIPDTSHLFRECQRTRFACVNNSAFIDVTSVRHTSGRMAVEVDVEIVDTVSTAWISNIITTIAT